VRYKSEVHAGEQPALVDAGTWEEVQARLQGHGSNGGGPRLSTRGFLLQGLLRCAACDSAMTPSHTRRGCRRYRYYVCTNAQKRGWDQCPSKSIPAGQIEAFVVEQVGGICRDPSPVDRVVADHDKDEGRSSAAAVERCADEIRTALTTFDLVWPTLPPAEQARVMDLVVQRVAYDGGKQTVAITFHPTGLGALADELAAQTKEKSA
jgi:site-specific DNA recombinase